MLICSSQACLTNFNACSTHADGFWRVRLYKRGEHAKPNPAAGLSLWRATPRRLLSFPECLFAILGRNAFQGPDVTKSSEVSAVTGRTDSSAEVCCTGSSSEEDAWSLAHSSTSEGAEELSKRSLERGLEGAGLGGSGTWACRCSCLDVQRHQVSAHKTEACNCSAGASAGK